jgi:hypothetical protein
MNIKNFRGQQRLRVHMSVSLLCPCYVSLALANTLVLLYLASCLRAFCEAYVC